MWWDVLWGSGLWVLVVVGITIVTTITLLTVVMCGMWEKRPARTWRAERRADEPMASAYAEAMNAQAAEHGFCSQGTYRLSRSGRLKFQGTFWFSPERDAIAVVAHGGAGPLKQRCTLLISRVAVGRWLVTTDDFGEPDVSRVTDSDVLLNADFGELVERHWRRFEGSAGEPETLREQSAEEAYFKLETVQRDELVRRGAARLVGGDWRYTFGGALRTSLGSIGMQGRAIRQLARSKLPRPGDKSYTPRYATGSITGR